MATYTDVTASATEWGTHHAAAVLAAYETGAMCETFDSVWDVIEEWGQFGHLTPGEVLSVAEPAMWTEWTAGEWTSAVDRECDFVWAMWREQAMEAFQSHVLAHEARWMAVAVDGGAR